MPKFKINDKEIECTLILFDVDGTLIDDKDRYRYLAKARIQAITQQLDKKTAETWANLEGVNTHDWTIDMKGPLSKAPRRDDLIVAATAIYLNGKTWTQAKTLAETIYNHADKIQKHTYQPSFYQDVPKTLEKLHNKGFKLGIATNGQTNITWDLMKQLEMSEFFSVVVGADLVDKGKPAPDMILKACEDIDVSVSDTVYVGDQPTDVQASRAANVGLAVGIGADAVGADIIVESVAEFVA